MSLIFLFHCGKGTKEKKPIFSERSLRGMLEFWEGRRWQARILVGRTVVELPSPPTLIHLQGACGGLQKLLASGEKPSGAVDCCVELGKCRLTRFGGDLIGSLAGTVPLPFCSVVLSRPESLRAFYVKSRTGYFKDRREFTEHGFCGYLIQDRI